MALRLVVVNVVVGKADVSLREATRLMVSALRDAGVITREAAVRRASGVEIAPIACAAETRAFSSEDEPGRVVNVVFSSEDEATMQRMYPDEAVTMSLTEEDDAAIAGDVARWLGVAGSSGFGGLPENLPEPEPEKPAPPSKPVKLQPKVKTAGWSTNGLFKTLLDAPRDLVIDVGGEIRVPAAPPTPLRPPTALPVSPTAPPTPAADPTPKVNGVKKPRVGASGRGVGRGIGRASAGRSSAAPSAVVFTAYGPKRVTVGEEVVVSLWASTPELREAVAKLVKETTGGASEALSAGAASIRVGAKLTVALSMSGKEPVAQTKSMVWNGSMVSANFGVKIPAVGKADQIAGDLRVLVGKVEIVSIPFVMKVVKAGAGQGSTGSLGSSVEHARSGFASYSSRDRKLVVMAKQALERDIPGFDLFVDVMSLRAGEDWQKGLTREIKKRDRFYLFWSRSASESEWVEREWRLALKTRGIKRMTIRPIDPPHKAPPPKELRSLHFNDPALPTRYAPPPKKKPAVVVETKPKGKTKVVVKKGKSGAKRRGK